MKQKKVSNRVIRTLASRLYHKEKRTNATAIVAIAMSAMLVIIVLSTIMSVNSLLIRQKQMLFGTQAEGVYMNTAYTWFEKLRDSGHFDEVSMVAYMGTYKTELSTDTANKILYTDEETAEWNFNKLQEGKWPQAIGEIVVDEHFVRENGDAVRVGDTVQIDIETSMNQLKKEVVITGICAANDEQDENRIYVSEDFFRWDRSGTLNTYCRFDSAKYEKSDLEGFLKEIVPDGVATVVINPGAGGKVSTDALVLVVGVMILTVVCAGLMIYIIYYISVVRNVKQYGQLKLIGISERQIRKILWLQAFRQYVIGLPIGCTLGCVFSYMLMPFLASFAGVSYSSTLTIKVGYFLYAAVVSFAVIAIGIQKPMNIIVKTPPIHTFGFTGSTKIKTPKLQSERFTFDRFARRNLGRRRKKTMLVVISMCISMVLFVFTMNLVHSLDVDSLLQEMNLFADIEIASEDVLNGMESGILPDVQALPSGLRDQLEQVCNKMDVTYHYNLDAPTVLYGDDAEEYSKIILDSGNYYGNNGIEDDDIYIQRANAFRKGDNAILLQQSYRFYDYEQMEDFEIFEGSIDKAKFESGEYVIAVALTGEGDSYYHVGDVVSLYDEFPDESAYNYEKDENGRYTFFDQLATKKYTVMAVVSDKYQNLMNGGNSCQGNLEYIFPTKSMEYMSETPDLFMITMDAPDNKTLQTVEPLIQTCLNSMGGEDVVSYRSRGVYKSQLDEFGRMIALIGNGLALVVGLMSIVNFLNSCISGIAERREEFATLQAIGMTKEKLLKVVRRENLYTILLAVIPGYVIGHLLSAFLIQKASESIEYVACNITPLPGLVLALGITLLSMVYPNRKTDIGDRKY